LKRGRKKPVSLKRGRKKPVFLKKKGGGEDGRFLPFPRGG